MLGGGIRHEYVSNSSATDADDTTSFVTGTTGEGTGAAGGGSVGVIRTTTLTADRVKGVQFASTIKASDLIYFEVWDGTNWLIGESAIVYNGVFCISYNRPISIGGTSSGVAFKSVSTTRINVIFSRYALVDGSGISTVDWSSTNFTSGTQWRVHKISFS